VALVVRGESEMSQIKSCKTSGMATQDIINKLKNTFPTRNDFVELLDIEEPFNLEGQTGHPDIINILLNNFNYMLFSKKHFGLPLTEKNNLQVLLNINDYFVDPGKEDDEDDLGLGKGDALFSLEDRSGHVYASGVVVFDFIPLISDTKDVGMVFDSGVLTNMTVFCVLDDSASSGLSRRSTGRDATSSRITKDMQQRGEDIEKTENFQRR